MTTSRECLALSGGGPGSCHLLDERGTDGALLLFHGFSDALVGKTDARREFTGRVWIDAHTCIAFISRPGANAYVGLGSAARGHTAPREKSWERAEQGAGRR